MYASIPSFGRNLYAEAHKRFADAQQIVGLCTLIWLEVLAKLFNDSKV